MEYTKEEFRKQVAIGIEYAEWTAIKSEDLGAFLTDHLWGTVGTLLQNQEREHIQKLNNKFGVKKEYIYNEPVRVDEGDDEIEGQKPVFTHTLEQDKVHMGIDEIDEHEGEITAHDIYM